MGEGLFVEWIDLLTRRYLKRTGERLERLDLSRDEFTAVAREIGGLPVVGNARIGIYTATGAVQLTLWGRG